MSNKTNNDPIETLLTRATVHHLAHDDMPGAPLYTRLDVDGVTRGEWPGHRHDVRAMVCEAIVESANAAAACSAFFAATEPPQAWFADC